MEQENMETLSAKLIEVALQHGFLGKCLVAQRASKRLDASVVAYVAGQVTHIALQVLENSVTPPAKMCSREAKPIGVHQLSTFLQWICQQQCFFLFFLLLLCIFVLGKPRVAGQEKSLANLHTGNYTQAELSPVFVEQELVTLTKGNSRIKISASVSNTEEPESPSGSESRLIRLVWRRSALTTIIILQYTTIIDSFEESESG
ncbi:hypothetical protein FQN60_008005 [Etheostoma spectabile]|uniref:Uncharacterized protein n=1 Tax=Etheostoma spectabile TaxID=54343 RepID=A0A5J5CUK4_9PERO|nr:hypothetical protein FQN60_008005 [Etheostoma spectabile]